MKLMRDVHFEDRLRIDYHNNNNSIHIRSTSDLDCCFMAILSWEKPPGPRMMRTLWSNSRERMEDHEKRRDAGSSYPEGFENLLEQTAKRNRPTSDYDDNHAPEDYDIRQSERVLELKTEIFG